MRVSQRAVSGIDISTEGGLSSTNCAAIEPASRNRRGENKLSNAACRALKPTVKPYKKSDGRGLYLLVKPSGTKLWQWPYDHAGKANVYSIGAFPEVSIAEARAERDKARKWLRAGLDPNIEKKADA